MKTFKKLMEDTYSADYKLDVNGNKSKAKRIAFDYGDEDKKAKKKDAAAEKDKVEEKLDLSKAKMGTVITDFQDSDAPQFKGKSKEKRRQMAIAAKLQADDDMKEELSPKQKKIDKNKNGKIDGEDLQALRKEELTPDQKAKRLQMIRKSAQKLNKRAEMDAKRAMRRDPQLGKRKKDPADIDEAVGTAAKHAGKTGFMGGKYQSHDHMMTMKNFSKVRDDRAKKRDDEHKAQDPKMQKMGYAKHMVDTNKAKKKAAARGVDPSKTARSDYHNKNGITPNRKLPEDHTAIAMGKMIDDEGSMALSQIDQMERAMKMVRDYIGGDAEKQLPAWVQSKITLAAEYIDTVGNYLSSDNEKVNEGYAVKYNHPDNKNDSSMKHFDSKDAAQKHADRGNKIDKVGGKYTVHKTTEKGHIEEATPNRQQVKQAIGIARDKRYAGGNMTGATKVMDKINKGLAQHPAVAKELKKQNEETSPEKKKGEDTPVANAKILAKYASKHAEKTVAQHKEGVQFDSEGNLMEASNKITFHQFMGATKKKKEKKGGDDAPLEATT